MNLEELLEEFAKDSDKVENRLHEIGQSEAAGKWLDLVGSAIEVAQAAAKAEQAKATGVLTT